MVRRAEATDELTALGGDVVLVDGPDLPRRVAGATGNAKISLALDGVGGSATQRLLDSIVEYGTVAVYAAMSGAPSAVAGPQLIFLGQSIRGFWIVNWLQAQTSFDKVTTV